MATHSHDGFLSYSHEVDGTLGPAVERALERIAKPLLKLRALNIFRDESSLTATPGLWPSIVEHLASSRWFLLMASRASAASPWCNQETRWWLENRSPQSLLIILTDGEIVWDKTTRDFDWTKTTALSTTLSGQFADEPFYVDLRRARDGDKLSLSHGAFRDKLLDIAAPLRGVKKDELDGADVRQLRRNLTLVAGMAAAIAIAGVFAVVQAFAANAARHVAEGERDNAKAARTEAEYRRNQEAEARKEAEHQQRLAQERERLAVSRQLAAQADNFAGDQLDLSLLLSLSAYRLRDTVEARGSILNSLQRNPRMFLRGHTSTVSRVVFSADGRTLVSGSMDGKVVLWDAASGQQRGAPLAARSGAVLSLAFSPTQNVFATGTANGTLIWDIATRRSRPAQGCSGGGAAHGIAFSPDGTLIAASHGDGHVVLCDAATGQRNGRPMTLHRKAALSVAFMPNGRGLVSGGEDGSLIFWDLTDEARPGTSFFGYPGWIQTVAISPDGETVAFGAVDGAVGISGKPMKLIKRHGGSVATVAFSPDGKTLASASSDRSVILWNVETGASQTPTFTGHRDAVRGIAFSPDGLTLASAGADSTIVLWDTTPTPRLARWVSGRMANVFGVAVSPDHSFVASTTRDGTVVLWDAATGRQSGDALVSLAKKNALNAAIGLDAASVAFGPDGKRLFSGGPDGKVVQWDVATRRRIGAPLAGHETPVLSVAVSPDGTTLASASWDSTIRLWDLTTGKSTGRLTGHQNAVASVAFSSDGKLLASGSHDKTVALWDVATGQRLRSLAGHENYVNAVAFSPDDLTLASGSSDRSILLWDVRTGERRLRDFVGHADGITSVAFSGDGKTLASGSGDKTVILWDLETGQRIGLPLTGHSDGVRTLAFDHNRNGEVLVSGSWDGTVMVWDVSVDSWRSRACRIANRDLTQTEWTRFVGIEPRTPECTPASSR